MRAVAILPVKRFGSAKSRLAESAAGEVRPELARAMLADVLSSLQGSGELERVVVVSGEPAAQEAAERVGATWIDDDDGGHSRAALRGVEVAIDSGASCVALLPGDCPLLQARELDQALAELEGGVAGVIPDRHGNGTNGLLLAPPDAIEPAFGQGSRERHLALARRAGVEARVVEIPSLALDLDTAEDLHQLTARLRAEPELAPATAAALQSLGELGEPADPR